jgi:hypothetical protein
VVFERFDGGYLKASYYLVGPKCDGNGLDRDRGGSAGNQPVEASWNVS